MAIVITLGSVYATTFISDLEIDSNDFDVNSSGFYLDDIKITRSVNKLVGFTNSTDFPVNDSNSRSQIQAAVYSLNSSSQRFPGGRVLMMSGNYTLNSDDGTFIDLNYQSAANEISSGISLLGEGYGTVLIKNHTSSGAFTLGNAVNSSGITKNIEIGGFTLLAGHPNQTFHPCRLLNGNPSSGYHDGVYIHDIYAPNCSTRFINVDASNMRIERLDIAGGWGGYGGSGSSRWFINNKFIGTPDGLDLFSEVEGIEDNNDDGNQEHIWAYGNYIRGFYEQQMDIGSRFAHIFQNTIVVKQPTDQGGITMANDYFTVFGNIAINASQSRGGIEHHAGANSNTYLGNIIITNDTNISSGTNSSDNTIARCMRLDGKNSTLVGNIFLGCETPFQGSTGNQNQLIGNWFEPDVSLDESYLGVNYVNGYWKIQGANVNITRNVTINNLAGSGNAIACINSIGQLYRGNDTGCP